MKQILVDLLTKLFGYKYFIVVYQVKDNDKQVVGNLGVKIKRLIRLDRDFIVNELVIRNDFKKENILITNVIRIAEWSDFYEKKEETNE